MTSFCLSFNLRTFHCNWLRCKLDNTAFLDWGWLLMIFIKIRLRCSSCTSSITLQAAGIQSAQRSRRQHRWLQSKCICFQGHCNKYYITNMQQISKLVGLQKRKFILSQCWRPEVHSQDRTPYKDTRGESSPCLLQRPVAAGILGYGHTAPVSSPVFI